MQHNRRAFLAHRGATLVQRIVAEKCFQRVLLHFLLTVAAAADDGGIRRVRRSRARRLSLLIQRARAARARLSVQARRWQALLHARRRSDQRRQRPVVGEPAEEQFIIDGLRAAAVIVGMVRLPSGLTAY